MFEMPMTSRLANLDPSSILTFLNDFSYLHDLPTVVSPIQLNEPFAHIGLVIYSEFRVGEAEEMADV